MFDSSLTFIEAVIHWLAEFPGSPLSTLSTIGDLVSPLNLYRVFILILNEEDIDPGNHEHFKDIFAIDYAVTDKESLNVPFGMISQVSSLEVILRRHTKTFVVKSDTKMAKEIYNEASKLNWLKIILLSDIHEIASMCQVLLRIGTTSSKLSTFGLTSVGFLNAVDQEQIDLFLQMHVGASNHSIMLTVEDLGVVTKPFHLKSKEDGSDYIDEDHLNAILWEKELLESLLYELVGE